MVGAGDLAVLELGLGHGGAEGHVPHGGGLGQIGVARGDAGQEGALGDGAGDVVDGPVGHVPVDGQAETGEEVFEDLLVLDGELLAELDEVPAGDHVPVALVLRRLLRRAVALHVRLGGVAADAVVVLHTALGGQAVVVPAHRVEHVLAVHALVPGEHVGLRVGEDVAHMQGAGGGRRGSVDRVDLLAGGLRVERVRALVGPAGGQLLLEALEGRLVRHGHGAGGGGGRGRCVDGRVCALRVLSHARHPPMTGAAGRACDDARDVPPFQPLDLAEVIRAVLRTARLGYGRRREPHP